MSNESTPKRKRGRPRKTPDERKQGKKNLRIAKRVQFAIEFWSQFADRSETSFIEEAIEEHAAEFLLGTMESDETKWERLDKFRAAPGDYYGPGRAMAEALKKHGMTPPPWPPEKKAK